MRSPVCCMMSSDFSLPKTLSTDELYDESLGLAELGIPLTPFIEVDAQLRTIRKNILCDRGRKWAQSAGQRGGVSGSGCRRYHYWRHDFV